MRLKPAMKKNIFCGFIFKRLLIVAVIFIFIRSYRMDLWKYKWDVLKIKVEGKSENGTKELDELSTKTTSLPTTEDPLEKVFQSVKEVSNLTLLIPERFVADIKEEKIVSYDRVYDVPDAAVFQMQFHIQPNKLFCKDDMDLLLAVKSSVNHFAQRNVIRSTWGKTGSDIGYKLKIVFLLGIPKSNPDLFFRVKEEQYLFGDIILGSYIDSYKNLTLKTLTGFQWMNNFCSNYKLFMSVDDDVTIDVGKVIEFYKNETNFKKIENSIECGMKIVPNARVTHKGVWAVPFARYSYLRYPPYCLGPCYIMGSETAKTIFSQSRQTHCDLSVDDVMISGVLRIKAGLDIGVMPKGFCQHLTNSKDIETKILEAWKKTPV